MRSLPRSTRVLTVLAIVLAACSGSDSSSPPPPPPPPPSAAWTWVPLAGSACSDGSATGIGIEHGTGDAPDVLVVLMGGGACWDFATCFVYNTATRGPFGESELDANLDALVPGSILDRSLASNPFRDYTFVFVPYCTGDVHVGDTVQTYATGAVWRHKGRVNLGLAFDWLAANVPAPAKVVVSGYSAGGFGSLYALDLAHATFGDTSAYYLVDDSGPPLDVIPQSRIDAWYASWDMGGAITPICGTACATDLSQVLPALAARYPADRLALLSSTQDATIRFFFGDPLGTTMDANVFEGSLRALVGTFGTASVPNGAGFLASGTSHTMLGDPASFTSGGVSLTEWLRRDVEDDAAWATVAP